MWPVLSHLNPQPSRLFWSKSPRYYITSFVNVLLDLSESNSGHFSHFRSHLIKAFKKYVPFSTPETITVNIYHYRSVLPILELYVNGLQYVSGFFYSAYFLRCIHVMYSRFIRFCYWVIFHVKNIAVCPFFWWTLASFLTITNKAAVNILV